MGRGTGEQGGNPMAKAKKGGGEQGAKPKAKKKATKKK
jgi:hypothetical protein